MPIEEKLVLMDEDGMVLLNEDLPVFYSDATGNGMIVVRVSETDDPVYMQIAASDSSQEKREIYYDTFENRSFYEDTCGGIPFAVKLWQSGDNHYLPIYAERGLDVYHQTEGVYIYRFDQKKMTEINSVINSEPLILETLKNGYLKGKVNVIDDKRLLFTTIPYEQGWEAKVNNTKAECVPVLNGTFLGVVIPDKGDNEIELKYHCPGVVAGGVASVSGLISLIIQILSEKKKRKNNKNEKKKK